MMKKACLVLEGGGLRGAFTSGVLEHFMDAGLFFEHVIGVSAGACIGASYLSGQKGRNRKVNVEYPSDKRYMGLRHLLLTGSYFNMPFVFGELPRKLVPFDEQAFYNHSSEYDIVTTSLSNGKSVVFSKSETKEHGIDKVLIASSSIPLLANPVEIAGTSYLDGGVADPIPLRHALEKYERVVVVLTRPRGYRKPAMKNSWIFRFAFRKYPEFLATLLKRNEAYNNTLDLCDVLERAGRVMVIAPLPAFSISRLEPKLEKRMGLYNHGYAVAQHSMPALNQLSDL